ncbi:hypothetical protein N7492_007210 [Penicillium capsulatum]|uniref:Zn(2)-C6 fungal-type domain-containing protein n=1 Tax=Penicillium capsulatum TaxID=69766 RepID=A0A9W9I1K3_9EURO|nr:hypothetical protein N7492_007210 [Penicillium capsulatum]KAJ6117048.1 hypothetical protein N7512_006773 [Penicillium capsulatum]
MSAPARPRKRTKTFTGCWTCRTRKIKCDEGKPFCRQCLDKGFECEGYTARLQWLTPVTHERGLDVEDPLRASISHPQRRLLPTVPLQSPLELGQIDDILRYLDSLELVVNAPNEDVSASIKNFGVFSLENRPPNTLGEDLPVVSATPCVPNAFQPGDEYDHLLISSPGLANGDSTGKTQQDLPLLKNFPDNPVMSTEERFLMGHYSNRVVNLFCVIDNAKSPWKTIHLPRVLQCAGELSFGATTTRIRDALRNSLLSISAFYLSNDHRANNRSLEAEKWGTAASRYRCDAIRLLKYAVETDLYADRTPKYKEFLATMLSMITINVMSGDTTTCSVHLNGAERLISHTNTRKSKFSRKAKSLHRIYLYLRVIYESTAVKSTQAGRSRFSPSLNCSKTFGPEPMFQNHGIYNDDDTPSSALPMTGDMSVDGRLFPGSSSYECIYGIPLCLLLLLKETIEVIDAIQSQHNNDEAPSIPQSLNQVCDVLEQKIMDWPLEERLRGYGDSRNGTSLTIIYHQTCAFLNALIIFFSQGVRFMGHRYLRQYVHKILDSIEAIERLKAETKLLAAPLFWPAFMGATEAFEPMHQERFRRWYARVEIYGMEAGRTGSKVVHEVWRRGPANYREMHSGWREVVKQRDECLMLT